MQDNVDPSGVRKRALEAKAAEAAELAKLVTFESAARTWFGMHAPRWSPVHAGDVISSLERDVFPLLGARPVVAIDAPAVLKAVRVVEDLGVNRRAKLTPYRRPILTPPFGSLAVIPVVDRRGPRTTTRTVRCAGGGVRGRSLLTHRVNRRGWGSGGRGFRLSSGF
ncbi:phage integrase central domain-containing protein [Sphingomonas sp. IC081]|uniref:phage integrase central domain-containing protein n=1 Tax=Sphingomonas sp. IC081 TaxID=304378 RepID=UPI003918645B